MMLGRRCLGVPDERLAPAQCQEQGGNNNATCGPLVHTARPSMYFVEEEVSGVLKVAVVALRHAPVSCKDPSSLTVPG